MILLLLHDSAAADGGDDGDGCGREFFHDDFLKEDEVKFCQISEIER